MKFNIKKLKFFYINLESRSDRRTHMEKILTNAGVDYERFDAIKPTFDDLEIGKYKWTKHRLSGRALEKNKTALSVCGIYLSHYSLLKKMKDTTEPFVILEDDLGNLRSQTLKYLNRLLNGNRNLFSDNKWNLIRPFVSVFDDDFRLTLDVDSDTFRYPRDYLNIFNKSVASFNGKDHAFNGGAHFCLINKPREIIDFLDSQPIKDVDFLYSTHKINSYLVNFMIYQDRDKFGSDVC